MQSNEVFNTNEAIKAKITQDIAKTLGKEGSDSGKEMIGRVVGDVLATLSGKMDKEYLEGLVTKLSTMLCEQHLKKGTIGRKYYLDDGYINGFKEHVLNDDKAMKRLSGAYEVFTFQVNYVLEKSPPEVDVEQVITFINKLDEALLNNKAAVSNVLGSLLLEDKLFKPLIQKHGANIDAMSKDLIDCAIVKQLDHYYRKGGAVGIDAMKDFIIRSPEISPDAVKRFLSDETRGDLGRFVANLSLMIKDKTLNHTEKLEVERKIQPIVDGLAPSKSM